MKLPLAPSRNCPSVARNLAAVALLLLSAFDLRAQQTTPPPADDQQVIQMLLQRIDQLEASQKQLQARVRLLEKGHSATPASADPPTVDQAARAEQESEPLEPEKTDVSKTL